MDDHETAYDLRRVLADTIAELGRVKTQRDELAAALTEMLVDQETLREPIRNEAICERAREALTKVKEGN